ncbi:mevalonate kinase [Actinotignum sp. GS-2025a]|uniref:mevalonate kinase n=1 Tax=Actinotignum sp. GS-2025a TaxID=3427274 RepID=UPI003F4610F6
MSQSQSFAFDTQTRIPKVRIGVGRAHGKAILFGEHAVVYGAPAISLPVHVLPVIANATITTGESTISSELYRGPAATAPERLSPVVAAIDAGLDFVAPGSSAHVTIYSDIPYERGLGSSAAVAAAIVSAIADAAGVRLSPAERFLLIQVAERVAHGRPSGMDAHGVVADTVIKFQRPDVTPLIVARPLHVVIGDSGVPGATRQAVGSVRELREKFPAKVESLVARLAGYAADAEMQLATGDWASMGENMWRAHATLAQLGVSSPELDAMVNAAHGAGALGAKMTGGGIGGCVIALAENSAHAKDIAAALSAAGAANAWSTWVEASK